MLYLHLTLTDLFLSRLRKCFCRNPPKIPKCLIHPSHFALGLHEFPGQIHKLLDTQTFGPEVKDGSGQER